MRGLHISALLACASAYITLEEAYGPVAPNPVLIPWRMGSVKKDCGLPLEIVIVQDVSDSFQAHIDNMRDVQVAQMTKVLEKSNAGSKFGVVSFRDKPVRPHGSGSDFCERFDSPLSEDSSKLKEVFSRLTSAGGGDPNENQFGAIIAAVESSMPGWSDSNTTKLVVLATDACPHFADDGANINKLGPFSGHFDEKNADHQCRNEYYPSPTQVRNALDKRNAYLAQLIFDGNWRARGAVRQCWEWFNSYLEQDSAFVEPLAQDGSNFWPMLAKVIETIESPDCHNLIADAELPEHDTTESTNTVSMQFEGAPRSTNATQ